MQISWQQSFVIVISLIIFLPSRLNVEYSLIFDYRTHKILHILGIIMFAGNILVTTIWMFLANKTKNNEIILFTSKTTDKLDRILTAPGLTLVVLNGLIMADAGFGGPFELNWMLSVIARLLIIIVIWGLILVPKQGVMIRDTQEAVDNKNKLSETFNSAYKRWMIWNAIIMYLLVDIVYYMITKPELDF